jgi:hypothetical protein
MSQEIHEHSENSTLEPQAMNDLKNVRDDYESSKPEKADHDNELDKISYISTLDPAARYDISKNHDNVESSILYPSAYNDLNDISIDLKKKKTILLLYLNKNTFLHQRDNLTQTIMTAKDAGITIVLVHEQDSERDWCDFSHFFEQTPQILVDPPYELYGEMAIPLYTRNEYRIVSLRKIITRMGEVELHK